MTDWISTETELPIFHRDVLIVDPYNGIQVAAILRPGNSKKQWIWEGGTYELKRIKYWQPLPLLPV